MILRKALQFVVLLAALAAGGAFAADQVKVVYHFSDGMEQASNGLRNIKNHLSADPGAKIVVVAHFKGIDFLLDGAEDKNKNPYNVVVEELADKGVEFRVCNFTLQGRGIDKSKLLPQSKIVPSGVAEISKLQSQEGFAYLKP